MSRWNYFAKRLLLSIPVVLFGLTTTFIVLRLGPLDPVAAIYGPNSGASATDIQRVRESLHLNDPLWEQYVRFMWSLLTFDGSRMSWVIAPNTAAYEVILNRAPKTVWMGFWAVLIPLFIGIPMGFYAGLRPNTWGDYIASFGGIVWRAAPNFWLAVILMMFLSQAESLTHIQVNLAGFNLDWAFNWKTLGPDNTRVTGAPDLTNLTDPEQLMLAIKRILPASIILGSASLGTEMRIGRTAMLETKNSNYVEMAKAKGVSRRALVWKHMFRNALIPLVPVITAEAGLLLGGSVIVESVFGINGIGDLFLTAIVQGDVPLVGALMYLFILLLVSMNIVQDFLYTIIDPRVGYESD